MSAEEVEEMVRLMRGIIAGSSTKVDVDTEGSNTVGTTTNEPAFDKASAKPTPVSRGSNLSPMDAPMTPSMAEGKQEEDGEDRENEEDEDPIFQFKSPAHPGAGHRAASSITSADEPRVNGVISQRQCRSAGHVEANVGSHESQVSFDT
eukprot:g17208.t1